MDKITGNYTEQSNGSFPFDCETLDYIATNARMLEMLGNIAGDKAVLYGCTVNGITGRRNAGYVFLRTRFQPEGEVLYAEAGAPEGRVYLAQSDISVTTQGYTYPKAYTRRWLTVAPTDEDKTGYAWSDFTPLSSMAQMAGEIAALKAQIAAMRGEPAGIVKMFAGQTAPAGYAICNGQEVSIAGNPQLFAAIGTTYNNAVNAMTGSPWATPASGFFRLPDLRGRFVVGQNPDDQEYKTLALHGGEKKHILSAAEMPQHSHSVDDYFMSENISFTPTYASGIADVGGRGMGSGDTDNDNTKYIYKTHETASAGSGTAHENRPPYYVLAYIIKLG